MHYLGSRGSCFSLGWQADATASACPGKEVNRTTYILEVYEQILQKRYDSQEDTNLSWFVKASVSGGSDVRKALLVVWRRSPG